MQPVPLILTRPTAANAAFRDALPESLRPHLRLIECPLIEIVAVPSADPAPEVEAAIFTSSNGVRFAPAGAGRVAFCVGEKTTVAAQAAGWDAQYGGPTAAALVVHLKNERVPRSLVHFCGRHVRGDIGAEVASVGHTVKRVVVYDQPLLPFQPEALSAIKSQKPVVVPLFSPRTAAYFAEKAPENPMLTTLCLSSAIADEVEKARKFNIFTVSDPTSEAMVHGLEKILTGLPWVEGSDTRE